MKTSKFLSAVVVASMMVATVADAGSIGRSGGSSGGSRSSSSFSSGSSASKSSSFSAPSKPSPAPAPAAAPANRPGGIGGNTTSVGVRKSEVTQPVAQSVNAGKPGSFGGSTTPSTAPSYSNPSPSYGSAPSPGFSAPSQGIGAGGVFMSSLGGSLAGTMLGNALFGHGSHGGGTTVINNGTPSGSGGSVSNGAVASGPGGGFVDNGPGGSSFSQPKKEYTVWSFIADVFGFVIVVALLLGVAWLFYKGFQLVRNFINKERGVSTVPFNPTQKFWEIQKAFATADLTVLQTLLGPDVVDELTNGLAPSTLTLHNVSHEIRLSNNTEFSIWYTFEDDGQAVNQVWHYEKFGKDWKLNGIENV
jgi:hypothetical protein